MPPSLADAVPTDVTQVHSSHYRNPDQLPPGSVLVVGSGGSGSQIAEELCEAGRRVHLAVSRHRRVPRRHRGRDATWWLLALGVLDRPLADLPDGRPPPSLLVTGVGGGHDMDVRALRAQGVQLYGTVRGIADGVVTFAADAEAIAAEADVGCAQFARTADEYAARNRLDVPAYRP